MKFLKYEDFRSINEIGEGVPPLKWTLAGRERPEDWVAWMKDKPVQSYKFGNYWSDLQPLIYQFKGKEVTYQCDIHGKGIRIKNEDTGFKKQIHFWTIVNFQVEFEDKMLLTNRGEQFSVVSTVVDIIKHVIGEMQKFNNVYFTRMEISPKFEEDEQNLDVKDTKRGRFYGEYLKKQISGLPGKWNLEQNPNGFFLVQKEREKMSSKEKGFMMNIFQSMRKK